MIKLITNELTQEQTAAYETMVKALDIFNVRGYNVSNTQLAIYNDQDGNDHYILINPRWNKTDEDLHDISRVLNSFYNYTFMGGDQCANKTKLMKKLYEKLGFTENMDATTLASFMCVMNPMINPIGLMSEFWYNVMQIMHPDMFN